jgi:hypothetical protein
MSYILQLIISLKIRLISRLCYEAGINRNSIKVK